MAGYTDTQYNTRILTSLRRVIRAVDLYSRRLYAETGLTTPQLVCLHVLAASERMTVSELARSVSLSISTVNGIIDRLEVKGLLTRTKSPEDRRKVYVLITSTGRDTVLKAPSLLQDRLAYALDSLPESEQLMLTESLERVVWLMEAEHVEASPNLFSGAQVGTTENRPQTERI